MSADLLLVLDRRDTVVRLDMRALRIEQPDTPPQYVPLRLLGLVVVYGRALVACDVWRALAERDIPAVLLPGRGAGNSAWVGAALSANIALRSAQHRAAECNVARLQVARQVLHAKLAAYQAAAGRLESVADNAGAVFASLFQSNVLAVATAPNIAALLGIEGHAAAVWFQGLAAGIAPHWQFHNRNRRPPRDPVNALLSLGYTLIGGEMLGAIQQAGLDPARGLFHESVSGREALVLDLIEPLRPAVDVVVLNLLDRVLTPADFTTHDTDGCRLTKDGRARFYQAWATARKHWPDLEEAAPDAVRSLRQVCNARVAWLRGLLDKSL